ncbi:hypothetical protein H072_6390 [Dactylellina haptotyla CBS 200.50]|uniref:Uncharacterized protein n=1 Tax=Dactylellina haptotyla (strain CBS 200.50) TaxID=1284197 RepID=S8AFE3_DACHA|nr:hypothetical protein H072_6390 [Dactylellina haptotyla CBS 200.50]
MSAESSPEPPQLVTDAAAIASILDARHTEAFGALGDLELEFEKAEVEVLKFQIETTQPLYARRNTLTTSIPSFWPTVFDSCPDFDQHVAPQDVSAISTIKSLNIVRPNPIKEPRDFIVEIGFDSENNEWFEDEIIRKRFWWKTVEGAWSGLVSEPVEIKWKEGADLSNGETGRVYAEWKAKKDGESTAVVATDKGKGKGKGKGASNGDANGKKKSLEERLSGGQPSFFTWFSWVGKGTDYDGTQDEDEDEDDEDEDDGDLFNHGDELALTLADDIYPNAIKYFLESLTGDQDSDDEMSVSELDSDEEIVVIGGEEYDSEEENIGGSSRIKRADITLESDDEDESSARRKRVKK